MSHIKLADEDTNDNAKVGDDPKATAFAERMTDKIEAEVAKMKEQIAAFAEVAVNDDPDHGASKPTHAILSLAANLFAATLEAYEATADNFDRHAAAHMLAGIVLPPLVKLMGGKMVVMGV